MKLTRGFTENFRKTLELKTDETHIDPKTLTCIPYGAALMGLRRLAGAEERRTLSLLMRGT